MPRPRIFEEAATTGTETVGLNLGVRAENQGKGEFKTATQAGVNDKNSKTVTWYRDDYGSLKSSVQSTLQVGAYDAQARVRGTAYQIDTASGATVRGYGEVALTFKDTDQHIAAELKAHIALLELESKPFAFSAFGYDCDFKVSFALGSAGVKLGLGAEQTDAMKVVSGGLKLSALGGLGIRFDASKPIEVPQNIQELATLDVSPSTANLPPIGVETDIAPLDQLIPAGETLQSHTYLDNWPTWQRWDDGNYYFFPASQTGEEPSPENLLRLPPDTVAQFIVAENLLSQMNRDTDLMSRILPTSHPHTSTAENLFNNLTVNDGFLPSNIHFEFIQNGVAMVMDVGTGNSLWISLDTNGYLAVSMSMAIEGLVANPMTAVLVAGALLGVNYFVNKHHQHIIERLDRHGTCAIHNMEMAESALAHLFDQEYVDSLTSEEYIREIKTQIAALDVNYDTEIERYYNAKNKRAFDQAEMHSSMAREYQRQIIIYRQLLSDVDLQNQYDTFHVEYSELGFNDLVTHTDQIISQAQADGIDKSDHLRLLAIRHRIVTLTMSSMVTGTNPDEVLSFLRQLEELSFCLSNNTIDLRLHDGGFGYFDLECNAHIDSLTQKQQAVNQAIISGDDPTTVLESLIAEADSVITRWNEKSTDKPCSRRDHESVLTGEWEARIELIQQWKTYYSDLLEQYQESGNLNLNLNLSMLASELETIIGLQSNSLQYWLSEAKRLSEDVESLSETEQLRYFASLVYTLEGALALAQRGGNREAVELLKELQNCNYNPVLEETIDELKFRHKTQVISALASPILSLFSSIADSLPEKSPARAALTHINTSLSIIQTIHPDAIAHCIQALGSLCWNDPAMLENLQSAFNANIERLQDFNLQKISDWMLLAGILLPILNSFTLQHISPELEYGRQVFLTAGSVGLQLATVGNAIYQLSTFGIESAVSVAHIGAAVSIGFDLVTMGVLRIMQNFGASPEDHRVYYGISIASTLIKAAAGMGFVFALGVGSIGVCLVGSALYIAYGGYSMYSAEQQSYLKAIEASLNNIAYNQNQVQHIALKLAKLDPALLRERRETVEANIAQYETKIQRSLANIHRYIVDHFNGMRYRSSDPSLVNAARGIHLYFELLTLSRENRHDDILDKTRIFSRGEKHSRAAIGSHELPPEFAWQALLLVRLPAIIQKITTLEGVKEFHREFSQIVTLLHTDMPDERRPSCFTNKQIGAALTSVRRLVLQRLLNIIDLIAPSVLREQLINTLLEVIQFTYPFSPESWHSILDSRDLMRAFHVLVENEQLDHASLIFKQLPSAISIPSIGNITDRITAVRRQDTGQQPFYDYLDDVALLIENENTAAEIVEAALDHVNSFNITLSKQDRDAYFILYTALHLGGDRIPINLLAAVLDKPKHEVYLKINFLWRAGALKYDEFHCITVNPLLAHGHNDTMIWHDEFLELLTNNCSAFISYYNQYNADCDIDEQCVHELLEPILMCVLEQGPSVMDIIPSGDHTEADFLVTYQDILALLLDIKQQLGKHEDILDVMTNIMPSFLRHIESQFLIQLEWKRVDAYFSLNRTAESIAPLKQLIQNLLDSGFKDTDPDTLLVRLRIADCYRELGREEDANKEVTAVLPLAEPHFIKDAEISPNNLLYMAEQYLNLDNHREASRILKRILHLPYISQTESVIDRLDAELLLVKAYKLRKNYLKAHKRLIRALRHAQQSHVDLYNYKQIILFELSVCAKHLNCEDEAAHYFLQSLIISANNLNQIPSLEERAASAESLARSFGNLGHLDKKISLLKVASHIYDHLNNHEQYVATQMDLANTYSMLGNRHRENDAFLKILKRINDTNLDKATYYPPLWTNIAMSMLRQDHIADAISMLTTALRFKENPLAHFNLAIAYAHASQLENAQQEITQAEAGFIRLYGTDHPSVTTAKQFRDDLRALSPKRSINSSQTFSSKVRFFDRLTTSSDKATTPVRFRGRRITS